MVILPDMEGYTARPEDVILAKMQYYREGGSEKHLRDITGILKVSGEDVDRAYVNKWAEQLNLKEIWDAIQGLQQQIDDLQSTPVTANTYVIEQTVLIDPGTAVNITVSCEAGDIALSGGYRIDDNAILHHFEPAPYDVDNPTGWRFLIINPIPVNITFIF